MSAAFDGISLGGYQGNLTISDAVSGSSGVTAVNLIAGATSGVATANITASSAGLASLASSASDAITITINDAASTSVSATALSAIGGKTSSAVTVSNAVVISGTVAQNIAALVTADTKVIATSAAVTLSDATDTPIAATDIVSIAGATSGIVAVSSGIAITGSGTEVKQAVTLTNLTLPADFDVSVTGALNINEDTLTMLTVVAKSSSGDLMVTGTTLSETLNASSFEGDGFKGLTIKGGNGSDAITGTDFGDVIVGGTGSDNLTGGTGADIFEFNATGNGLDTITDFTTAQNDILDLDVIISGGIYSGGTPVVDTTGDAIALANLNNLFVYYSVADISSATIDEASLFGANQEFAAEGSADIQFVLAVGETTGTDGVQLYQVTDSAAGNDMSITQILTLDNASLADILVANLDVT
jgi:Ca2+-binding RTX toxin-like protein